MVPAIQPFGIRPELVRSHRRGDCGCGWHFTHYYTYTPIITQGPR